MATEKDDKGAFDDEFVGYDEPETLEPQAGLFVADDEWPAMVSEDVKLACMRNYRQALKLDPPMTCCCCGRKRLGVNLEALKLKSSDLWLLEPLRYSAVHPEFPWGVDEFKIGSQLLDGFMLEREGIRHSDCSVAEVYFCPGCLSDLKGQRVPRYSYANYLYRGRLPERFRDLTLGEEMICSRYRTTAYIIRLKGSNSDDQAPLVMSGNCCAHELNTVSTANVLPRTPTDVRDLLTVVFIGSGRFDFSKMGTNSVFRVRKRKVLDFLRWLSVHNPAYKDVTISSENVDQYPEDGTLTGLEDSVIVQSGRAAPEGVGFDSHVSDDFLSECTTADLFLEKVGIYDPENDAISGRAILANAVKSLLPQKIKKRPGLPDLFVAESNKAVPEYKNPMLFPGMYPTLFPYGTGGLEDSRQKPSVGFQKHVEYLMDSNDRSFRYHESFLFVATNIIQRRGNHLGLHTLQARHSKFQRVAEIINSVSGDTITAVANHLAKEGKVGDLNNEQKRALEFLTHVNAVSTRVPGSQAAKLYIRSELRSYYAHFGTPQLYFTFNPSAVHSPVFHYIYGDTDIDLNAQFPQMPQYNERAKRLAKDPDAAAQFFEFSFRATFEHLFGWNFQKRQSKAEGGILGKLKAWFGVSELTKRAQFHGHFVLWFALNTNPKEIRAKIAGSEAYAKQFFDYFDSTLYHHLPDLDISHLNLEEYEPRLEMPPEPPKDLPSLSTWDEYTEEVKKIGEKFQRHSCKAVCHEYGHEHDCRFLFPHLLNVLSHYEQETNSIRLRVLDPWVNWFNDVLLVCNRHNQDLKCILTGTGALAALFYITDYITKMDKKRHEILAVLGEIVTDLSKHWSENLPPLEQAKRTLLRCVSRLNRRKEIHGQQAARYLRGFDDGIRSHLTVPMLSSVAMAKCRELYPEREVEDALGPDSDDEAEVDPLLTVTVDEEGQVRNVNQFHDYYYRGESLDHLSFYEFSRCVERENLKRSPKTGTASKLTRHKFDPRHPLVNKFQLVLHSDEAAGFSRQLVPRMVGMSIPRVTSPNFCLFALCHFKPFSCRCPLIVPGESYSGTFQQYEFGHRARQIMANWEAVYECEDQREADRESHAAERAGHRRKWKKNELQVPENMEPSSDRRAEYDVPAGVEQGDDYGTREFIGGLKSSNWLGGKASSVNYSPLKQKLVIPRINKQMMRVWRGQMHDQESEVQRQRRDAMSTSDANASLPKADKSTAPTMTAREFLLAQMRQVEVPETRNLESLGKADEEFENIHSIVSDVRKRKRLNRGQYKAFSIIASHFLDSLVVRRSAPPEQLVMLLTGPGGTGKTHVVNSVQEVMSRFSMGHIIRFLAPTGSAAALMDGMTVHKGLCISVKPAKETHGNKVHIAHISVKNRMLLREEWANVSYLLVDEVSLASCQLLAEMDSAFRYAKEREDAFFGGINIIFSGDLCQFPPVTGTPLYKPIQSDLPNADVTKKLGRLAWKQIKVVVELTEQKRMERDPQYAEAVQRLRMRVCTEDDRALFNSRVIKTVQTPQGVDMGNPEFVDSCLIVAKNELRRRLNALKAESNVSGVSAGAHREDALVKCWAYDTCNGSVPERDLRMRFFELKFTSSKAPPAMIPLYVGMPVILRNKNIATDLKLTNGADGIVRYIQTNQCPRGYTYAEAVIVEFPNSKITLKGLPPKHYPIEPTSWPFRYSNANRQSFDCSRRQIPIQPAFAVTGHAAQGRTLPKVTAPLHEGGFGAYVAASRPCQRQDLTITKFVDALSQLNRPLPIELRQELDRLKILAHNTDIEYGFMSGELLEVPNFDVKMDNVTLRFNVEDGTANKKRKLAECDLGVEPLCKKTDFPGNRTCPDVAMSSWTRNPYGPVWDAVNHSCAYDAALMALMGCFASETQDWREVWKTSSVFTAFLGAQFDSFLSLSCNQRSLDGFRDMFRDMLSETDPLLFRRHGTDGAAAAAVLQVVLQEDCCVQVIRSCENSCAESRRVRRVNLGTLTIRLDGSQQVYALFDSIIFTSAAFDSAMCYDPACGHIRKDDIRLVGSPSVLVCEFQPEAAGRVLPPLEWSLDNESTELPATQYRLRAIIYQGGFHFTLLLFLSSGLFYYDSARNAGKATLLSVDEIDASILSDCSQRHALLLLYTRSTSPSNRST